MTTIQAQFVRKAILRFKQKTLEHKHDQNSQGWEEAHDQFASRLDRLEAGIIEALQGIDPKNIHR